MSGGLELDPDLSAPPAAPAGGGDIFPIPVESGQVSELRGNLHFVSRLLPQLTDGKREAPTGT